jgi:hypothetical protein
MEIKSVKELEVKMKELMHDWHPGGRPGHHGDAGNTLERLLGVAENNFSLPDFGEVELKVKKQRNEDKSLLTLFRKEPKPRASVPKLIKSMGWKHAEAGLSRPLNERSFCNTTYGSYYTVRGLKVNIEKEQISIIFDPSRVKVAERDATGNYSTYGGWLTDIESRQSPHYSQVFPIFYEKAEIEQQFKRKLNHTLLVHHKKKVIDGIDHFCYVEALLMQEVKVDMICPLLLEGVMAIDFNARSKKNHGTAFRIKRDSAKRLFTYFSLFE